MKRYFLILANVLVVLLLAFVMMTLMALERNDEKLSLLCLILGMDGAFLSVWYSSNVAERMLGKLSGFKKVLWSILSGAFIFLVVFLLFSGILAGIWGGGARGGETLHLIVLLSVMVISAALGCIALLSCKLWGLWRKKSQKT